MAGDTLQQILGRYRVDLQRRSRPIPIDASKGELPALFRALGFLAGAEIGVWKGGFSELLCKGIPGLHLRCVDTWAPYAAYREKKNDAGAIEAAFVEAQTRLRPYRCDLLRMSSADARALVPDRSLDFVYIDANHERPFVLDDLQGWSPKVRAGGIVAGHDFRDVPAKPFIQVKAAVETWTREHWIDPWFILTADRTPSFFWVVA